MKTNFTIILIAFLFFSCKTEKKAATTKVATIVINTLPPDHDFNKDIYISGDFEGWSGGKTEFKLERKDKTYSITLPKQQKTINFKFTLGNWDSVETDLNGEMMENRSYTFSEISETVTFAVQNWASQKTAQGISTKQPNVETFEENFNIPQLNRTRKISVYLPPNYEASTKSYPVLYMHDGQNVFDKATSYSGEWEVDETLNKLHQTHGLDLIVIAIDNSENRMQEYTAWENKEFGKSEGKQYVDFIANTLKPAIDKKYRTKSDSKNTAIMGSSMGGLISQYAVFQYPNVFGKAGIFSPSFWFSDKIIPFTKSRIAKAKNSKLYYVMGEKEGGNMVIDMQKIIHILETNNFSKTNLNSKFAPNGTHSEAFWRSEFEEAILWLFSENIQQKNIDLKPMMKEVTTAKLASGKLMRAVDFPSNYVKPRTVEVWLPTNYSATKKYNVVYMHDGQNLFDATTTWNNQEWKIDETAAKLMNEGKVHDFIVVAIYSAPGLRWQDYFPQKAFGYMNATTQEEIRATSKKNNFSLEFNGDDYLKFLTEELKPYIDQTFATKTEREHTFIAGSSMGGLISMYAICEYPEIFGGTACLSTHWIGMMPVEDNPFPTAIFEYMEENLPSPATHKFYFDYGTKTLDQHYIQYAEKIDVIFRKKGYTSENYKNLVFEGADHSEISWQKRLHIPFTFLLKAPNGH
ncbi:Endo-1,4-beta-xylanase/feruloyl esterase [Kordia antarctica]|uniref:Endo-1,4-beta-xylanase/feruloyl esterase n=1 Tax=Kordia antarctica TaxID=1218801 RepID=A0A7L4ZMG5_9FLAO|nr:alpha/beta hydrolase-fold protein [Kordia antarctica]QHI37785.1 Endo-1,4-beta-xylanase/feruloyl esterase [Kordia antarctica]